MKARNILISVFAVAALGSCDFLDEYNPNSVTTGNFYKTESDVETSVNGIYSALTQSYYFTYNHYFTDVRANATIVKDAGAVSGIPYQFYNFTLTEENSYVYNRYAQMYRTVSRANKVLAHIDDVTWQSADTRDVCEAEARFLRALTYFYLVTEWGDVPLVLKDLTTTSEVKANNVRAPKADVYKAIAEDLEAVVSSPIMDFPSASECGRASKAAAYALLGKVFLQQACDEDFAGGKDDLLKSAETNLRKAWDLRKFSSLTDVRYSDIWSLSTQKGCPENIFQINCIQGNESLSSSWNWLFGPNSTGVTSKKLGNMQNITTSAVYDSFEDGDVRKGFLRRFETAGQTYYHTMKYVDLDCGTDGFGGNNWVVLRYADVALMLAETCYWQGNADEARTWMNMVRARAGLPAWSGADLRQGIYDERLHEFMQEGLRWQDVLRMYSREEMIAHYNAINSNFGLKDLLLPIPYNERIQNPDGLYQNPGYGN